MRKRLRLILAAAVVAVSLAAVAMTVRAQSLGWDPRLGTALGSADGALYVRNYGPNLWTCSLNNLANTLTECQPAAAAGQRHYITDVTVQTSTATSGQYAIQTGTGTNCGTATAPLFPIRNVADRWNAPTNAAASDTKDFTAPLRPTVAHAICVIGTATNTINIQIQGFDAP